MQILGSKMVSSGNNNSGITIFLRIFWEICRKSELMSREQHKFD